MYLRWHQLCKMIMMTVAQTAQSVFRAQNSTDLLKTEKKQRFSYI